MYWVNQNLTKRIHLIWKKYWLLIFELRKIRFQNLWGPRTIEVNKITMNLIPGKILKMFPHDSFIWFIIILTSNKDKKFQRKWKFEWRMRPNTVSTQILSFSDSNKRGKFEIFWKILKNFEEIFCFHLSAETVRKTVRVGPSGITKYPNFLGRTVLSKDVY